MKRLVLALCLFVLPANLAGCGGSSGISDGQIVTGPVVDQSDLPEEVRKEEEEKEALRAKSLALQKAKAAKKAKAAAK